MKGESERRERAGALPRKRHGHMECGLAVESSLRAGLLLRRSGRRGRRRAVRPGLAAAAVMGCSARAGAGAGRLLPGAVLVALRRRAMDVDDELPGRGRRLRGQLGGLPEPQPRAGQQDEDVQRHGDAEVPPDPSGPSRPRPDTSGRAGAPSTASQRWSGHKGFVPSGGGGLGPRTPQRTSPRAGRERIGSCPNAEVASYLAQRRFRDDPRRTVAISGARGAPAWAQRGARREMLCARPRAL